MLEVSRKNIILVLSYLIGLTVVLVGYLFMVALPAEGYDPEVYKKGYLYFVTFQLLLFSLLVPFGDDSPLNDQLTTLLQKYSRLQLLLRCYACQLLQITILSVAAIPLILIIFMVGQLNQVNFIWPLLLQILWGLVILSVRWFLAATNLHKNWQIFILMILVFTFLIVSLIFCYFYIEYGQLVITTVYDKDIPLLFFLNPLLTTVGLLYVQTGGTSQLGWGPVICNVAFSSLLLMVVWFLTARNLRKHSEV